MNEEDEGQRENRASSSTTQEDLKKEDTNNSEKLYNTQTDDEFQAWVLQAMTAMAPELREKYPQRFLQVAEAVLKWRQRYRGNAPCWKRFFKPDRVIKEVVESVPVVDSVLDWMSRNSEDVKITILDLCSGKGYLSMLLSEILPQGRVEKILLIDKAWPLCHTKPRQHHMNWEHIYGNKAEEIYYFDTWPISLVTSKQNLKQARTIQQLQERFTFDANDNHRVLLLGVHLCGTLSIQAIQLYRGIPNAELLVLKPCCLPDMSHTKQSDSFVVGNYCFPTKDVCAAGKWKGTQRYWEGPPRWHLQPKFQKWCHYLHEAMGQEQDMSTSQFEVPLQTQGGFQNTFLVGERGVPS